MTLKRHKWLRPIHQKNVRKMGQKKVGQDVKSLGKTSKRPTLIELLYYLIDKALNKLMPFVIYQKIS